MAASGRKQPVDQSLILAFERLVFGAYRPFNCYYLGYCEWLEMTQSGHCSVTWYVSACTTIPTVSYWLGGQGETMLTQSRQHGGKMSEMSQAMYAVVPSLLELLGRTP